MSNKRPYRQGYSCPICARDGHSEHRTPLYERLHIFEGDYNNVYVKKYKKWRKVKKYNDKWIYSGYIKCPIHGVTKGLELKITIVTKE